MNKKQKPCLELWRPFKLNKHCYVGSYIEAWRHPFDMTSVHSFREQPTTGIKKKLLKAPVRTVSCWWTLMALVMKWWAANKVMLPTGAWGVRKCFTIVSINNNKSPCELWFYDVLSFSRKSVRGYLFRELHPQKTNNKNVRWDCHLKRHRKWQRVWSSVLVKS